MSGDIFHEIDQSTAIRHGHSAYAQILADYEKSPNVTRRPPGASSRMPPSTSPRACIARHREKAQSCARSAMARTNACSI